LCVVSVRGVTELIHRVLLRNATIGLHKIALVSLLLCRLQMVFSGDTIDFLYAAACDSCRYAMRTLIVES